MILTLEDIRKIGLTETESKIYLYLLENQEKSQKEIAAFLGVSKNRASVVLSEMENKNIINTRVFKKNKVYFISGVAELEENLSKKNHLLFEQAEKQFETQQEALQKVVATLKETQNQGSFQVSFINNEKDFTKARNELVFVPGRKEIVVFNNLNFLKKSVKKEQDTGKDIKKENTNVFGFYVASPEVAKKFSHLNKNGVISTNTENIKQLRSQIILFDDRIWIIDNESEKRSAIIIKNKNFSDTIKGLIKLATKTVKN